MKSIYKSAEAKTEILSLYDKKLASCEMPYEEVYVDTFAGKTHVLISGDKNNPPVILLHGINAGAPLALEAMKGLEKNYCIYAVDSIGQASKSAETRLPVKDLSYGKWLSEVIDKLGLTKVDVIGVSYGAFFLSNLIQFSPQKVKKAIYVVPSAFVNGGAWRSIKDVSIPLIRFYMTKNENDLIRFMDAFYNTKDEYSVKFQKAVLTGVHMDFRKPPLVKSENVKAFKGPVYAIIAGDDVFFPGDESLKRIQSMFSGYKDSMKLSHSKHIPDVADYPVITSKIGEWLAEKF